MRDGLAEREAPADPEHLGARFVAGDERAFEALFRVWQGEVFRWVLRIVRDRGVAEEITAEAFWRAYRSRARFDPSRSFGAWMRRIATNAALDHLRRARPAIDDRARLVDIPGVDPLPGRETRDQVAAALGHLSPKLRVVVMLGLIEDRPYAEIADALEISVATVKTRMSRAMRGMRRELERRGVRP
jgi:RNA polymerase sigma factor (sigma-70 family)